MRAAKYSGWLSPFWEKYSGWLTENSPKSQRACGKLPASGQIETLSLSVSLSLAAASSVVFPCIPIRAHFVVGRAGSSPLRPPPPRLFALTGQSPIHRADVVSPFSRSLGLLRRGPAQGPRPDRQLAPGAPVTAPALWPAIPRCRAPATDLLAGFGRCRLSRVSDTRSNTL